MILLHLVAMVDQHQLFNIVRVPPHVCPHVLTCTTVYLCDAPPISSYVLQISVADIIKSPVETTAITRCG